MSENQGAIVPDSGDRNSGWTTRARGSGPGHRLFVWVIKHLGLRAAYALLIPASLQYLLFDKTSRAALTTYRERLGLRTTPWHLFLHFYSFGRSLVDRHAFLITGRQFFTYDTVGEEKIRLELSRGKGLILLGAHVGNSELAGKVLGERTGARLSFVMYDGQSREVKEATSEATAHRSAATIPLSEGMPDTAVGIVNALREGGVVCLHGDRVVPGQRSVAVPFLGRTARFPVGPFAIALLTGAPVIPFFAISTGPRRYLFEACDAVTLDSAVRDHREAALKAAVATYAGHLERAARRYPLQWFNFFDFWAG